MKASYLLILPALCVFMLPAQTTVAKICDGQLKMVESEFVPLVEAMPANKFDFKPSGTPELKDVRTFAEQAKHVAAVMYITAAAANKEQPPVKLDGETAPATVKSKEQIVQFVKDAFAYAHKATQALTAQNQLEMVKSPFGQGEMPRAEAASVPVWHTFDHYGQMVVYARMNGVVPPASRR